jgi:hypothetical protein
MTDDEFEDVINKWTAEAMGPPYVGAGVVPKSKKSELDSNSVAAAKIE